MQIVKSWKDWNWSGKEEKIFISTTYNKFVKEANWYEIKEFNRKSLHKGDKNWCGTDSLEEAVILAREGWEEGVKILENFCEEKNYLEKVKTAPLVESIPHVAGNYVDIGRYLQELPDCMIYNQLKSIPKYVTIICRIGFNCNGTQDSFLEYGKKIVNIIDFYEKQNIRIRLVAQISIVGPYASHKVIINIELKDFGEFVDLNKIGFTLCHPAFFRRLGFSFLETLDAPIISIMGFHSQAGYGHMGELHILEEEEDGLCIESSSDRWFEEGEMLLDNLTSKIK